MTCQSPALQVRIRDTACSYTYTYLPTDPPSHRATEPPTHRPTEPPTHRPARSGSKPKLLVGIAAFEPAGLDGIEAAAGGKLVITGYERDTREKVMVLERTVVDEGTTLVMVEHFCTPEDPDGEADGNWNKRVLKLTGGRPPRS